MQRRKPKHIKGIDVSHWQGVIDWPKVKAHGIEFVFIKATEGQTYVDPRFKENAEGALSAGLRVGFYHFAHPDNDPVKEAEHFYKSTSYIGYHLPPVLDLESAKGLDKPHITAWAITFLSHIKKLTGMTPMIYTYTHFAKVYLGPELSKWPLWIAHYGVDKPGQNGIWDEWAVFQYGKNGNVTGISGHVDLNEMDVEVFDKYAGTPEDYAGHWAEDAIQRVIEARVMVGYGDGTFKPDKSVTRAELAVVIDNLMREGLK
jgi:lysozyme